MRRVLLALGMVSLVAVASTATSTPASAFLEFLFGRPQAPAPAPSYSSRPLNISVTPKKSVRGRDKAHKPNKFARPHRGGSKVAGERSGDKPRVSTVKLQHPIDPEKNPDWFLTDPTLRYGDILVLKTGPVVYQGGSKRTRAQEDFVSLGQSRVVSSSRVRTIRMMVSGVWTPEGDAAPAAKRGKRRITR